MKKLNNEKYFRFFENIHTASYRSYFLDKFIPQLNLTPNSNFETFELTECDTETLSVIKDLQNELNKFYPIFDISNFVIFRHHIDQPIHVDGSKFYRYSSFNLPLSGYTDTVMNFYASTTGTVELYKKLSPTFDQKIIFTNYINNPQNLYIDGILPGTDSWVLINANTPHNVANITGIRHTLCIRFSDNLRFEEYLRKIETA